MVVIGTAILARCNPCVGTEWNIECQKMECVGILSVIDWFTWMRLVVPWWRHKMETFSELLAFCEGNSLVIDVSPPPPPPPHTHTHSQRPLTRNVNIFFGLRLNKRLSQPSKRRCFDTPSRSLWRQNNTPPTRLFVEEIWRTSRRGVGALVIGWFPSQSSGNVESVSMSRLHHMEASA